MEQFLDGIELVTSPQCFQLIPAGHCEAGESPGGLKEVLNQLSYLTVNLRNCLKRALALIWRELSLLGRFGPFWAVRAILPNLPQITPSE